MTLFTAQDLRHATQSRLMFPVCFTTRPCLFRIVQRSASESLFFDSAISVLHFMYRDSQPRYWCYDVTAYSVFVGLFLLFCFPLYVFPPLFLRRLSTVPKLQRGLRSVTMGYDSWWCFVLLFEFPISKFLSLLCFHKEMEKIGSKQSNRNWMMVQTVLVVQSEILQWMLDGETR